MNVENKYLNYKYIIKVKDNKKYIIGYKLFFTELFYETFNNLNKKDKDVAAEIIFNSIIYGK